MSERQTLERKAWKRFSRIVRLSAADNNGYCTCYTCGSKPHWKNTHCGHWITRGRKPTKYHLNNVRPQCAQCNAWGSKKKSLAGKAGEPDEFERKLKAEGVDTEELKELSLGNAPGIVETREFVEELKVRLESVVEEAYNRGVCDALDALNGA